MTTTIVNLGWSGNSKPSVERDFNEKIVMRTNRVLKKLDISECRLDGDCALTIICDYDHSGTIENITASLRRAAYNNESVNGAIAELVEEYNAAE